MDWAKVTQAFIVVTLVVIFGYDLVAMWRGGDEASISFQILLWSYDYPVFTFTCGFIMGHLFWRLKDREKTWRLGR